MNQLMKDKLVETAMDEINGMLREHIDRIDKSMVSALEDHDGEKQFKYPIALGLVIKPVGGACHVTAKISYSVRHADESIGQMVDPNQMKINFPEPDKEQ